MWCLVLQQPFCSHEVTNQKVKQSRAEREQKYDILDGIIDKCDILDGIIELTPGHFLWIFYNVEKNKPLLFEYSVICSVNIPNITGNSTSRNLS